jgi:hypothetical protein
MNDNIFDMIMLIITAAEEGRYLHGNGVDFYIMEGNKPTCVDVLKGTKTVELTYVGEPIVCTSVAERLTSFLRLQESECSTREYNSGQAHDLVKQAVNDNRLLNTNGADWTFVYVDGKSVIRVNLGQTGKATVTSFNKHASWKYLQDSCRITVSETTRKEMHF